MVWEGGFLWKEESVWKAQEGKGRKTCFATRFSGCFQCFGLSNEGLGGHWLQLDANPHRPSVVVVNVKDAVCREEGKIAGGETHSGRRRIPALAPAALLCFQWYEHGAQFWARMPSPREDKQGGSAAPCLPLPPSSL